MKYKDRLIRELQDELSEVNTRLNRLSEMDLHSIRMFATLLNQSAKSINCLVGVVEHEEEIKRGVK